MAWWRRRAQTDFDAEVCSHIDLEADRLMSEAGLSEKDAYAAARRRFGNVTAARERFWESQRALWLESLAQDARYATRQLARSPGFTAVVVLTLALGIGANAVMFGIVDRLLLRPPAHVTAPERLTRIYFREKAPAWLPGQDVFTTDATAFPMITALQRGVPSLEEVAGFARHRYTLGLGPGAREVDVALVTGNFFRLLGVRPTLGRFFTPDEDRVPVGERVAVVSHDFWRGHLGGARDALGAEVRVDNELFTVIGVAPRGFTDVSLGNVDMWVPVSALASDGYGDDWATTPNSIWIHAIGRIAPGATPERASLEGTVVYRRTVLTWKDVMRDTLGHVIAGSIIAARGPDGAPREARVSLWLVGVSGVVLLIACANIANLLLARAVRRRREIAVRLAMGVSRRRLVRQLLTETLLLATLAGGAALVAAHWGGQAVRGLLLTDAAWGGSAIDPRVLAFTATATVVTTLLAGLVPALRAGATDVAASLKAGVREGGGRRSRLQGGLLVAQAALSVVLLVGAGLFVRSLRHVRALDVGIDLAQVLMVRMDLGGAGFEGPRIRKLHREAVERTRQIPGVEHVALVSASVPTRNANAIAVRFAGGDTLPDIPNGGPYVGAVGADYFATLGARLVRGRGLTDADERRHARVVVVNETMARYVWPGRSPIGQCLLIEQGAACSEVVGVVQDVLLFEMIGDERGQYYVPLTHPALADRMPHAMLVRVRGDASRLAGTLRRELQSLAANMPYVAVQPFEELVAPELRPWRLGATMFGVFGALALAIAAVGLYSVLAYSVSQRTREMGVRLALGATPGRVVRLVVGDGLTVIAVGLALGALLALAAGRFVAPLLYETSPRDPVIFGGVAVGLLIVAAAASLVPAWRAARVDPSVTLRTD